MRNDGASKRLTEAEYLAMERASEVRHEFVGGSVFAMAGGSDRHNAIAANLVGELRTRLRGGPCRPVGSDQRHRLADSSDYVYPDVVVRCRDGSDEPVTKVVFEVLSKSTEAWDRGDKFARYQRDPAIEEVVLVSQRQRRVEHYRRVEVGRWSLSIYGGSDEVELPALGIGLPMDEIYLDVARERSDDPDDPYALG
ncbi:MAG: Uma2 family endonuclease [Myxococcota bacterium]